MEVVDSPVPVLLVLAQTLLMFRVQAVSTPAEVPTTLRLWPTREEVELRAVRCGNMLGRFSGLRLLPPGADV